jgi:hypothetical protein
MNVARIEKVSSAGDVRTLYDAQHGENLPAKLK